MNKKHDANSAAAGSEFPRAVEEALELLNLLLGDWKGQGRGGFPTIDSFEYSESLRFQRDRGAPYLTYEQNTDLVDEAGRSIRKSHWEAGILRPLADGSLELACVQGSGRVEILRGKILPKETLPEGICLQFKSEHIGNDERVKSSSRECSLTVTHLQYVMKMATSSVEEPAIHLEASLYKS